MDHSKTDRACAAPGANSDPDGLTDIVDQILDLAQADHLSVDDVLDSIGDASFAPILLLPALAVATPLSGVPLFSSLMGIVIALVSIQMLLRRDHLWFPGWLLRRKVKGDVVFKAFSYLRPVATWADAHTHRRLQWLVRRPVVVVPQVLCLMSGALMPMLEFVPFSSSIMGVGIALLALGIMTRDGVVLTIGVLPYVIVAWLAVSTLG